MPPIALGENGSTASRPTSRLLIASRKERFENPLAHVAELIYTSCLRERTAHEQTSQTGW